MLKMTKVELEKISNVDIRHFIVKGMRGAISYPSKRYSKINNDNCPYFDEEKPEILINDLNMNDE